MPEWGYEINVWKTLEGLNPRSGMRQSCSSYPCLEETVPFLSTLEKSPRPIHLPHPPPSHHRVMSSPSLNFSYAEQKSLIWKGILANAAVSITRCACATSMATVSIPETGNPLFSLHAPFHFFLTWRLRIAQRGDKRLHAERWMA